MPHVLFIATLKCPWSAILSQDTTLAIFCWSIAPQLTLTINLPRNSQCTGGIDDCRELICVGADIPDIRPIHPECENIESLNCHFLH